MSPKYKILLSAYACEPNKGSEPGVGWNWALEIVKRGHQVWVLTRKNNQSAIEKFLIENGKIENLNFIYYDLPKWASFWKKGGHGVHLYYFLWQIGILGLAKRKHKEYRFDFVHHITFVSIHQPSFLFLLKQVKFFYGPSAGGDLVPKKFLKSFPFKKRIKELLLNLQNHLLVYDPLRISMFRASDLIFCNSKQTISFLPKKQLFKTHLNLAIGTTVNSITKQKKEENQIFKMLYVGNFLHWKGVHLVLQTFDKINDLIPSQMTFIGKGNFNELETHSKFGKTIECVKWLPQDKLFELYSDYDVMIFPSFRDSGGMVVLEALSHGLPVVCLDLGGPGQIVNETCGSVIETKGKSEIEVAQSLADAILELQQNPLVLEKLRQGAVQRASEFSWDKTVGRVYDVIENYMGTNRSSITSK